MTNAVIEGVFNFLEGKHRYLPPLHQIRDTGTSGESAMEEIIKLMQLLRK
jgi:hypothetical protein